MSHRSILWNVLTDLQEYPIVQFLSIGKLRYAHVNNVFKLTSTNGSMITSPVGDNSCKQHLRGVTDGRIDHNGQGSEVLLVRREKDLHILGPV